jgi:hypothetical protein
VSVLGEAVSMPVRPNSIPNAEKPDSNMQEDFDKLTIGATSVSSFDNGKIKGQTAILPDGTKITMRSGSTSDGRPTIEVWKPSTSGGKPKNVLEVRYGSKK